jgi:hypothetical protein
VKQTDIVCLPRSFDFVGENWKEDDAVSYFAKNGRGNYGWIFIGSPSPSSIVGNLMLNGVPNYKAKSGILSFIFGGVL